MPLTFEEWKERIIDIMWNEGKKSREIFYVFKASLDVRGSWKSGVTPSEFARSSS